MKTLTMWQALLSVTFFILSAYQTAVLANDAYLLPGKFAQKYQSSGDIISEAVALLNTYLLPEKFAQKHQSSDDGLISEVAALINDGYLPPAKNINPLMTLSVKPLFWPRMPIFLLRSLCKNTNLLIVSSSVKKLRV